MSAPLPPGRVLAQDPYTAVSVYATLPVEVHHVLERADFFSEPYHAALDAKSGFAYLLTRRECYVWNYTKRSLFSPTTYTLPCPDLSFSPAQLLPAAALTTPATSREPGLLLVSPTGEIRFWEHVGMALSGVERFQSGLVEGLAAGEHVVGAYETEPGNYVLTTSLSSLFAVSLTPSHGRLHLAVRPFPRARGVFSRLFGAAASAYSSEPFVALALSARDAEGTRDAFVVGERGVQVWRVGGGSERLTGQFALRDLVADALFHSEEAGRGRLSVDVLDAACTRDGQIAVLTSYIDPAASAEQSQGPPLVSYAVVLLVHTQDPTQPLGVERVIPLSYRAHVDPRPYSTPRLAIPRGGPALFIFFADALLSTTLLQGSDYSGLLSLAQPGRNKFLGFGAEDFERPAGNGNAEHDKDIAGVWTLVAQGGVLLTQVDLKRVTEDVQHPVDSVEQKTARLKSRLEQAIYFGDSPENPLSFDIKGPVEGNLLAAAEDVSADVLASRAPNQPAILELRAQLADRVGRLKLLIGFVGQNGLLGKLAPSTRRRLEEDAEKLVAAHDLWLHQNSNKAGSEGLLVAAIEAFMTEQGLATGDDVVRLFFRTRVADLGHVLEHLSKILGTRLRAASTVEQRSSLILEANRFLLTALKSAHYHRNASTSSYRLGDSTRSFELWTSRAPTLSILESAFTASLQLVRDRTREYGSAIDDATKAQYALGAGADALAERQIEQEELRRQVCELADAAMAAFEERSAYFNANLSASGMVERDLAALTDRYHALRPQLIHPLVHIGKPDYAFDLAERYRAFRILTELCTDERIGSPRRVKFYLDRYALDFAFELYQWYLENGKLQTLLEQDEAYGWLLLKYLDATDNGRVAWIHDLAIRRYDHATQTLLKESQKEAKLAQSQLMLSISKLTYVAQLTEETLASDKAQQDIELIDDRLDLVSVHGKLVELFRQVAPDVTRLDSAARSEAITVAAASRLGDVSFPALRSLFSRLVGRLLEGNALSAEDLVDLLTLKDNVGDEATDYASALDVCVRAKDTPPRRAHANLQAVWRRVLLRDDWHALQNTAGLTDTQLADNLRKTALYQTLRVASESDHPPALFLAPRKTICKLTETDLAARFSDEDVAPLLKDIQEENARLQRMIDEAGLEDWHKEVMRIYHEDQDGGAMEQ